jgi:hypothetical protein
MGRRGQINGILDAFRRLVPRPRVNVAAILVGAAVALDAGPLHADLPGGADTASVAAPRSSSAAAAGAAAGATAGAALTRTSTATGSPIVAHDAVSPLRYVVARRGHAPRARALEASRALTAALAAEPTPDTPVATITLEDGVAVARVHGAVIASFTAEDALADTGMALPRWAAAKQIQLAEFVAAEDRRAAVRVRFEAVTLAVSIALLAALLWQAQRRWFGRWLDALEQRETVDAPRIFDVPLLSPDATRAALVGGLVVARAVASLGIVLLAIVGVGGRFAWSRPWVSALLQGLVDPLVLAGARALAALPGLLLAGAIALAAFVALRASAILLGGVAAGRVPSALVSARRAPVVRAAVALGVGAVALVLALGAAFGRFGTPLEALVLVAALGLTLGAAPAWAALVVGLLVRWRGAVEVGDDVSVGEVRGHVTAVRSATLELESVEGHAVTVPMLTLAWRPLVRHAGASVCVFVDVATPDVARALDVLAGVTRDLGGRDAPELVHVGPRAARVALRVPDARGATGRLWRAIAEASARGELALVEPEAPR